VRYAEGHAQTWASYSALYRFGRLSLTRLEPFILFSFRHLQELVYEGRHEPYADQNLLEKAIRQKWNEIDDHTIKVILQWNRHLAAVTKQDWRPIQYIFR